MCIDNGIEFHEPFFLFAIKQKTENKKTKQKKPQKTKTKKTKKHEKKNEQKRWIFFITLSSTPINVTRN